MTLRRSFKRAYQILAIGVVSMVLVGCQSVQTTKTGAFKIDRQQSMSMMLSSQEVDSMAAKGYREMMSQAKAQGALGTNKAQTARVKKIAKKLIAQVHHYRPEAKNWEWEVNVLNSDEVNAWAMPGGKMAVYTGFIKAIKPTDDELAAVIGHEIAHALREHGRESMSQEQGVSLALQVIEQVAAKSKHASTISQVAQIGADLGFLKPHSREQESEADLIGLELMARAGYNPKAAKTLWDKMAQVGGGGGPEFLSTHPSPENRAKNLTEAAEVVYPLYRKRK